MNKDDRFTYEKIPHHETLEHSKYRVFKDGKEIGIVVSRRERSYRKIPGSRLISYTGNPIVWGYEYEETEDSRGRPFPNGVSHSRTAYFYRTRRDAAESLEDSARR